MAAVDGKQRHTKSHPCAVCGGCAAAERGTERRCHGYNSTDGLYVHCSRRESAGSLQPHAGTDLYAHRRSGSCACGVTHLPAEPRASRSIEATYNYHDENGELLFQVVRFAGKDFRQRRPDDSKPDGWTWSLGDTRRVLYQLPALLAAGPDRVVYVVEGEKDADNLRALGLCATTNPGGALKWKTWSGVDESARTALTGRRVVLIPDTDEKGKQHAAQVAAALSAYVGELRVLWLEDAKDVSEWLSKGGNHAHLAQIGAAAPLWGSDDAFADRDAEPRRTGRTWSNCVDEVYQRADEPWVDIKIKDTIIATCRNGSFVPLIAPSGAGKSTLALQMLVDHAVHRGPAIYLTYELDGDEAVARAIGQLCRFSWAATLKGEVPRGLIPDVTRIRILDGEWASITHLEAAVREMRDEFGDQPILVVVDYMQATPAEPGKERGHAAALSAKLRRTAKKLRVVLIGVSQASTANSSKLRAGELLGIESASAGAETAQIERDAYVIMTLGDRQPVDPETVRWKLSIAKNRFGIPDLVFDLDHVGRIGDWTPVGEARSASAVREAADTEAREKKVAELRRSIVAFVDASPRPVSKKEIIAVSTGKDTHKLAAIKASIQDRELEFTREHRAGHPLIWTPERIREEAGKDGQRKPPQAASS